MTFSTRYPSKLNSPESAVSYDTLSSQKNTHAVFYDTQLIIAPP